MYSMCLAFKSDCSSRNAFSYLATSRSSTCSQAEDKIVTKHCKLSSLFVFYKVTFKMGNTFHVILKLRYHIKGCNLKTGFIFAFKRGCFNQRHLNVGQTIQPKLSHIKIIR